MSFASDNLEETFRKYTMESIMCNFERKFGLKASKPKLSSYHSIFPSMNNSYQQSKIASPLWQSQFKNLQVLRTSVHRRKSLNDKKKKSKRAHSCFINSATQNFCEQFCDGPSAREQFCDRPIKLSFFFFFANSTVVYGMSHTKKAKNILRSTLQFLFFRSTSVRCKKHILWKTALGINHKHKQATFLLKATDTTKKI